MARDRASAEIVGRVNARAGGGRLLLISPLRLLSELRPTCTDEALDEFGQRASLSFKNHSGIDRTYEAVATAPVDEGRRVTLRVLLKADASWRKTAAVSSSR